jgi:hypothetical protein
MDLPVTFDDAVVDYSLIGFGGAGTHHCNIQHWQQTKLPKL